MKDFGFFDIVGNFFKFKLSKTFSLYGKIPGLYLRQHKARHSKAKEAIIRQ